MRYLLTCCLLCFAAPAGAASGCEDVWFTRNLIMDRAGFCFASPLGQALFDNSDCTGQQVQLDPGAQALLERIRALEARHQCRVDTTRSTLPIVDMAFRRALRDLPVAADGEWACIGWTGPVTQLYDGHTAPLRPIGQIQPGDYVGFGFETPHADWAYVTIHTQGWSSFKSAGWLYWPGDKPCATQAG
jgi:hypothetical protein